MFDSDAEIFRFVQDKLYVPVICDILDALGHREQTMHQRIRPLLPDMRNCGFIGCARTVRWMETDDVVEEDPYGLELDLMDSLNPGDVVIHSTIIEQDVLQLAHEKAEQETASRQAQLSGKSLKEVYATYGVL